MNDNKAVYKTVIRVEADGSSADCVAETLERAVGDVVVDKGMNADQALNEAMSQINELMDNADDHLKRSTTDEERKHWHTLYVGLRRAQNEVSKVRDILPRYMEPNEREEYWRKKVSSNA